MKTQVSRFSSSAPRYSYIGKRVIKLLPSTTITNTNNTLTIIGLKGQSTLTLQPYLKPVTEKQTLFLKYNGTTSADKAMWGTTNALLSNIVHGVQYNHTLPIRMVGVGYRAALEGGKLSLKVGKSHPVIFEVPRGVACTVPAPQFIVLEGVDWAVLTQFGADIRRERRPEPYNQKGIFVNGETIKKKEGKKR